MPKVSFRVHLQKLADAYIHMDQQDFNFFDFFQEPLGQEFGVEIDWLGQFSLISLVISNIRPSTFSDNLVKWFSSSEFKSLIKRQKMGLRDRFRWWWINRAIKSLINQSNHQSDKTQEENAAFELLAEQKSRYIAIFVLSGYAYAEAYATSLLNQALEVDSIANYAWKKIKPIKQAFPTPPSRKDPEFTHFRELVKQNRSNALEQLDLIVRGANLNKEIETIEKQLKMPSVRGYFVRFLRIRNELAHDDPLKDLEGLLTKSVQCPFCSI